jgi:hypothetical protein
MICNHRALFLRSKTGCFIAILIKGLYVFKNFIKKDIQRLCLEKIALAIRCNRLRIWKIKRDLNLELTVGFMEFIHQKDGNNKQEEKGKAFYILDENQRQVGYDKIHSL